MADHTVVVTGGAGFIGTRVVDRLLRRGTPVRILDNLHRADHVRLAELAGRGAEVTLGDVRDRALVQRVVRDADGVIHLAAVCLNKSIADPQESLEVNLVGSDNVFEEAGRAGVRRVVFASSASVYGDPERLPMHETDLPRPQTPYCIAKLASEHLLAFHAQRHDVQWNALRFFNVYGPGQQTDAYYTSVILRFVERLAAGEPPLIDGSGDQSMDFVHVDDVADATVMAFDSDVHGQVFNVGTGRSTTIAQLARILAEAMDVDVEPVFRPRDVLVSRRAAAVDRARDVLGFEAGIDVERGLRDLVGRVRGEVPVP